ncbi:uncharacterized protein EV154DRAFT_524081 [Mucor mucedo]|uniref:uncharacterized protein n=1 Tax=Mucor mucedo TaxID=29922 RepID=UPI00221E3FC8|nr:uncharacterized protein EV154DRAFT_524081 [Mucor mucedo]KAI7880280.1 hypothetical protein EV154DRAFT_524081 [Mucor mucedo]
MDGLAFSPDKAINGDILMDYIPMKIHIKNDKLTTSPTPDSFTMVTQSFINNMHSAGVLFSTRQNQGTPLEVTFQLPEEEESLQIMSRQPAADIIDVLLTKKGYGKLYRLTGPYEQPNDRLLDILNMEFHDKPELLGQIAELLVNGIIRSKNHSINILTVEVYSRHASIDIHNESELWETTIPVEGRLFCGTVPASDGKGLKQKLMIGTNSMNALCTCSVVLGDC